MSLLVCAFEDEAAPAGRLAEALGARLALIDLHRFPDGESLPTAPLGADRVLVYRSLDRPDPKIVPLLLACDGWRRGGSGRLVLVAPYLCYMRQDTRFAPGQPISRDVIGRLLGERFDRIVTVDPHLHRTADIAAVFGTEVSVLSAARPLAQALALEGPPPLLIGPDEESERWTAALAAQMGAPHVTFRKIRHGDRSVDLILPPDTEIAGRTVVLVDDICSSGATLVAAARLVAAKGAGRIEAAVVHALFDERAALELKAAGVSRIVSTDSCPHPTNAVSLARELANALAGELLS
ncbi:MAG: ribose-phosphate diphosphokinase [Caulobacteraceae bacterium]|nr:ribose-phosphate diphosphokinase [Caulobacteraceae bacterium]